jgi:hypothetical protein
MPERRFPPPWSVEQLEACFVVKDHVGPKLAYVYFEDESRTALCGKVTDAHEARRIATNIAKLPLLAKDRAGDEVHH